MRVAELESALSGGGGDLDQRLQQQQHADALREIDRLRAKNDELVRELKALELLLPPSLPDILGSGSGGQAAGGAGDDTANPVVSSTLASLASLVSAHESRMLSCPECSKYVAGLELGSEFVEWERNPTAAATTGK